MKRDKEFDELLRSKISETLDEQISENVDADDLMFDLGMRYLRMKAEEKKKMARKKANQLSLWVKDAASRKALVDYVHAVTDKNSKDFIPAKDRIAVFDFDGTLFCESNPIWFDFMMLKYRVLEDPTYKDRATEHEKKVAKTVQSIIDTGIVPAGFEVKLGHTIAQAFAGMSVRDFTHYVRKFAETPSPCYNGLNLGDAFYQPMVQVIDYLQDKGFTSYVCSGSDELVIRVLVETGLILTSRHVIGTKELISAKNQGDTAGSEYVFSNEDELVLSGKIHAKNLKMTKVSMVAEQIGQYPVLAFGNSTGDISITNFVMNNPMHKSAAFFVCCDDEIRESGSQKKAQPIYDLCAENGWTPISMKNDWLTVFGEGVTKKVRSS